MAAVDIADVIGERYPRPSYARTNGVCLLAPKPIRRTAVSPRLSRTSFSELATATYV